MSDELVKLSQAIWDIQRYYATVSGPANLETAQTPDQLLAQVALLVDKVIVRLIPEEDCTTAQLRRAKNYSMASMLMM